jgi:glyoxylase-like metal-dependent hydrolase (beta-lactamase superfamily II)
MNLLEQQLHYPLGDQLPAPGESLELAPGVRWIRMALPFVLDHINLWLLRDEVDGRPGWTVVDCGVSAPESKVQWESIFATQLDGLPVLRVIATHMHPDHIGLADWLCQRWDAQLWISATDYLAAKVSLLGSGSFGGPAAADFFAAHGLSDTDLLTKLRGRTSNFRSLVPSLPSGYRRLMDQHKLTIGGRTWTCISGYGHAPEHIALYCDDEALAAPLLIGGDMMLPRISTNISVYEAEPESDPLALFLTSIDKFLTLDPACLVLPSHGKPFEGLQIRVGQLHAHHRDRLEEVMAACAEQPCSGADILPIMFKRPLDPHQTTFAMGEAIAHLHLLWFEGKLKRTLTEQGVYRFSLT